MYFGEENFEAVFEEAGNGDTASEADGQQDELGEPNAGNDQPSVLNEGDVAVQCDGIQSGSDTQMLSREMDVPNDMIGLLICNAGVMIRSLQDISGAKIQIMRGANEDPKGAPWSLKLVGTLENINRAEKFINHLIAEADAGGGPSLVAQGFSGVLYASGGEQVIHVPIEKVDLIIGKGGETIKSLETRSGAHIQLIQQSPFDGVQPEDKIVRLTGNEKQIETARQMIEDVIIKSYQGNYNNGQQPGPDYGPWIPYNPLKFQSDQKGPCSDYATPSYTVQSFNPEDTVKPSSHRSTNTSYQLLADGKWLVFHPPNFQFDPQGYQVNDYNDMVNKGLCPLYSMENSMEQLPCGVCSKIHESPVCPYLDLLPKGESFNSSLYAVCCLACGHSFNEDKWICESCSMNRAALRKNYCTICNAGTHSLNDCPYLVQLPKGASFNTYLCAVCCYSCGTKSFNEDKWICDLCSGNRAVLRVKYCDICHATTHFSNDCPVAGEKQL